MARLRHTLIVALVLAVGVKHLLGQSPTPVRFEAADIHIRPHATSAIPAMTAPMLRGERYDVRNATMLDLIKTAYGFDKTQIVGGPNWLDWDRFDVVARAPASSDLSAISAMLQALLAERFNLRVHSDTRPAPGSTLTLAGGGPKLRRAVEAAGKCDSLPNEPSGATVLAGMSCRGMTMAAFATELRSRAGGYFDGLVADNTGLQGAWDFDLKWTPKILLGRSGSDGVSLPDALERQLGLKLEQGNIPTPVLVVDAVNEKPADNPSGVAEDLPAPPPAEFDVADIKVSPPDAATSGRLQPGGRLDLQGFTMKALIRLAWTVNDDELIAGGPAWLDETKYTLVARSTSAIAGTTGAMQIDIDDLRLMLRALLVDRFALKTHFEDRPVSAYTLVADKPKLRPADSSNRTNCKEGPAPGAKDPRDTNPMLSRLVTCQDMTMKQFVEDLPRIAGGYIHVPVVDATGLDGAWDFTLNFTPAGQVAASTATADASAGGSTLTASIPAGGLSLPDAVERQLGLKLELRKRSLPVLVIDSVQQQPSTN